LQSYQKIGSHILLQPITETYLHIQPGIEYTYGLDSYTSIVKDDYIDHQKGLFRFLLLRPTGYYAITESFTKFGLSILSNLKKINYETAQFDCKLQFKYNINTSEDYANPQNKDAAIVKITELGLFDINHQLIAYAQFPPIEYRTTAQHISFNMFIHKILTGKS
jgi:hypothetical protein